MKRRLNGEGSIYQRKDGYWVANISIEGKPERKIFKESNDAVVWLERAKDLRRKLMSTNSGNVTFGELLEEWLRECAKRTRANTWESYLTIANIHVLPYLGNKAIGSILPADIQKIYDNLSVQGKSGSTIHKVSVVIKGVVDHAFAHNLIDRDPTKGTRRPSVKGKKRQVFTTEQAEKFLEVVMNSESQFSELLFVYWEIGGRLSEIFGLKWRYVGKGYVDIEEVLISTAEGLTDAPPKTPASRRRVRLSKEAMTIINIQPRRSEYVFTTASGKPHSYSNFRRQWNQWSVQAFGGTVKNKRDGTKSEYKKPIVGVTPHALRHMQAVELFRRGWTVADVQKRGGWESARVLMEIYAAHSAEERQKKMVKDAKPKANKKSKLVQKLVQKGKDSQDDS